MPYSCPHCSAGIDGVLTQETHENRLSAKGEEVRQLREALTGAQAKADGFDSVVSERDQLRGQVSTLTERGERVGAMAQIGVVDEQTIRGFESIFASEVAGLAEETRPTFRGWLEAEDGARAHPLLSRNFSSSPAPSDRSASGEAVAPAAPAYPAPNSGTTGAQPPTREQGRMSRQDLREYLAGLTPDQVKTWRERNGDAYGWAP